MISLKIFLILLRLADVESGLGLWAGDGASVYERYAIVGNTYQILLNKNPDFYRLVKEKFQEEIQKNSSWRPSHEKLRTIFESIVPTINGVSTSDYFKTIPVFSEEKLSGLYPVIRYTEFMSRQNIYLAYGDDYRHEFWWTFGDEKLGEANIPNWINKTKDSYDYYVPVFSEEPFVLNVNTIFGENAIEYIGKTRKTVTESNPIPRNLGGFSPSNLAFNKFPRGLYNQQIEFTNYTQHTANAKQNYYVMGTKNLVAEDKSDELIIYVGIDSQVAESAELQIGNVNIYSDIVNGTALFRTRSLSKNASGEFTIKVNGLQSSHTYIRNLIANGEIYSYERMQKFLIIDRDFDGTEDAYDDSVIELNGEPRFNYSQVESNSTELMNKSFQEQINYDVEYELTDDNILTIYSSSPLNRDETFVLDLLSDSNIIQSHNIKSGKVVIDLSKIELNSNELQIQLKSNEYNVFQDYSELFVIELNKDEDPYSKTLILTPSFQIIMMFQNGGMKIILIQNQQKTKSKSQSLLLHQVNLMQTQTIHQIMKMLNKQFKFLKFLKCLLLSKMLGILRFLKEKIGITLSGLDISLR